MSFDLGVWYLKTTISDREAANLYSQMCEGKWRPSEASPVIEAFYKELTSVFPETDSVADQGVDACPWNCALDSSEGHVLMTIAGSRVDEVAPVVIAMAQKHGLIYFDPQTGKVHLPPSRKPLRSRFHL